MGFKTRVGMVVGGVDPGDVAEAVQLDLTAEEAIGAYKLVYISSALNVSIADQSVPAKEHAFGMAQEPINISEVGAITTKGKITNPAWSFSPTVGPVYLSTTGDVTQVPPATGNIQVVGEILDTDTIFLDVSVVDEDHSPHLYDAVVDASGNGDFLLPSAAFAAGAKSVYLRKGIYIETQHVDIPSNGLLHGEFTAGAVINFVGSFSLRILGVGNFTSAGTIDVTQNSTSVVGTGTSFTDLAPMDRIKIANVFYDIQSITDDTNLELSTIYEGNSLTAQPFFAGTLNIGASARNITVTGSSGVGIVIQQATHTCLEEVVAFGCQIGYFVINSGNTCLQKVVMNDNLFYGCLLQNCFTTIINEAEVKNNAIAGILPFASSNDIIVNASTIVANDGSGVDVNFGNDHVLVSSCVIAYNSGKGVNSVAGTEGLIVDGCQIHDNGSDGIDFDGSKSVISDNMIYNNGGEGVQAGILGTVVSNFIDNNTANGINIVIDTDTIANSNIISNNGGNGITITTSSRLAVNSNVIRDNTGFGISVTNAGANIITKCNMISTNTAGNVNDPTGSIITDLEEFSYTWELETLATGTIEDKQIILPFPARITSVLVALNNRGTAGNTIVDINKGVMAGLVQGTAKFAIANTTMYTTQGNRPTIPGSDSSNAFLYATDPNVLTFDAFDYLTVDVDSIGTGASGLVVQVNVRRVHA